MDIRQCDTSDEVAVAGTDFIYERAQEAIAERGQVTLALSGGSTPWQMLRHLAERDLRWERVIILQVDERAAPDGDPDRNLVHIRESFADRVSLPAENLLPMLVTDEDLEEAAGRYARELSELAGVPPVLDVVHLGLGGDGHTASLVPGDPVLDISDRDVATTGPYSGHRRMTLTYPIINRARDIMWLVTGQGKAAVLGRMFQGDRDIPAGRVSQQQATVIADSAALSEHNKQGGVAKEC
jgi:6-phosphogluconolactonase